jgi:hypothetical protein
MNWNLNHHQIFTDSTPQGLEDYSIAEGDIHVYFRNLEARLIDHIQEADVVFGCVAWLTSEPILKSLALKSSVSIIVQKEDFLRPDDSFENSKTWKNKLHKLYSNLQCKDARMGFYPDPNSNIKKTIIPKLSTLANPITLDPLRCVGNYNKEEKQISPRMHNKFLIFARHVDEYDETIGMTLTWHEPYAVWTGSFNLSKTADRSLENAIYTTKSKIVEAYYLEFGQIMALSEPLDWTSEWCSPQWRIGDDYK